jgi:hypothetical protein
LTMVGSDAVAGASTVAAAADAVGVVVALAAAGQVVARIATGMAEECDAPGLGPGGQQGRALRLWWGPAHEAGMSPLYTSVAIATGVVMRRGGVAMQSRGWGAG